MRVTGIGLLIASVLGCSGINSPTQNSPVFDLDSPLRIETRWQVRLNAPPILAYHPEETVRPAFGGNGRIVVAASNRGEVVAVASRSGRVMWRFRTGGPIQGGVTIKGYAAYVGSADGKLYKLDIQSGSLLWDQPYATTGSIRSTPAVAGGKVVFQNNDLSTRTFAIDDKTGRYVWDKSRSRPDLLTIRGEGGATIFDSVVYAGYDDGVLMALSLRDGSTIWTRDLSYGKRKFVDIDFPPIVTKKRIFVSTHGTGVFSVGRAHGQKIWSRRDDGVQGIALGRGQLYVASGDRNVRALDLETGAVIWHTQLDYGQTRAPVVHSNALWISTGSSLVWLRANDGRVVARIAPDNGQSAAIAAHGNWISMVTNSGALVGARLH